MVEGGRTPCLTAIELQQLGFKIVFWPCTALYAVAYTLGKVFKKLHETGSTSDYQEQMLSFNDFNGLVGLEKYLEIDKRYKTD
jgi:methylisocitrate lyase